MIYFVQICYADSQNQQVQHNKAYEYKLSHKIVKMNYVIRVINESTVSAKKSRNRRHSLSNYVQRQSTQNTLYTYFCDNFGK